MSVSTHVCAVWYKGKITNKKLFLLFSALSLSIWVFPVNEKQMPTCATVRSADGTGYVYIPLAHIFTCTHNRNTYLGFENDLFQLGNNVMYALLMLYGKGGRRICLLYCNMANLLKMYWFC